MSDSGDEMTGDHLAGSERPALPSGTAYVDRTNRAPIRRVVVRYWTPGDWISERLSCNHPNGTYRPPFSKLTATRRCLICAEIQHAV